MFPGNKLMENKMEFLTRPTIAITGSNGKTTTKEMLASILSRRLHTFKSFENGNSTSHIQSYVSEITNQHEAVVLEYGMIKPDCIKKCCEIIQPNISVITSIGQSGICHFPDGILGIAYAKSAIIRGMEQKGILVLNCDDIHFETLLSFQKFAGELITISIKKETATYFASEIQYTEEGMTFFLHFQQKQFHFSIPIWGEHNVANALFAIAVSHRLGFSFDEIQSGLTSYPKPFHRLYPHRLNNKVIIIDDSMNASPESVNMALKVLMNIGPAEKTVILGVNRELGDYSIEAHRNIGRQVARLKINDIFTYKEDAKYIAEGALEMGFPANRVHHCETRKELHLQLATLRFKSPHHILVKGSNKLTLYKSVWFLHELYRVREIMKKSFVNLVTEK